MIPQFPIFKPLAFSDKEEINAIVSQFPPYSDFNFTSLWSWDVDNKINVSKFNEGFVVEFQDYITNDHFFSFMADKSANILADLLITHLQKSSRTPILSLVPEISVQNLNPNNFIIEEDPDNHDYILSVDELIAMAGNKFGAKRNFINRFKNKHLPFSKVASMDIFDPKTQSQILGLFEIWEQASGRTSKETENELKAIKKLLSQGQGLELFTLGVFINSELVGFSINELIHKDYGIIHYEKANPEIIGIFPFIKQQTAIQFKQANRKFINYEQDLGIDGLRKAKTSYHPVDMFKKFKISSKT